MFISCIIVFITLWSANNGVQDMSANRPDNHLKNKDDGDLHVDLDINDDDYKWVEYDLMSTQLSERFEYLDRFFSTEESDKAKGENNINTNDIRPKAKAIHSDKDNIDLTALVATPTPPYASFHSMEKKEVTIETGAVNRKGGNYKEGNQTELFCGLKTDKIQSGFRILKEAFSFDTTKCNCTAADACDIGFRGIKCLFADYKQHRQPFDELAARIWHVALIWLSVYAALAVPFWCIKGWCCCCLRCKFFKPQETIQEAKDYILSNPPGVLVTKKGAIIHYEPTEREKDCYEEFGHFMRTL